MINYERYVNFYTDFAFKKLFGTEANKELLISFLNALLHGKEHISDTTKLNKQKKSKSFIFRYVLLFLSLYSGFTYINKMFTVIMFKYIANIIHLIFLIPKCVC